MSETLIGYRFEGFVLDLRSRELRSGSQTVHLERRSFDILAHLLAHRSRLVSKSELTSSVWEVDFVSDNSLSSAVADIRRALDDRARPHRLIATIYGFGYRFIAGVEELVEPGRRLPTRYRVIHPEESRWRAPGLSQELT